MFYVPMRPEVLARFHAALEELKDIWGDSAFYGDHLITIGRNLAFLKDEKFTDSVFRECRASSERSMVWRFHTLAWAAKSALSLPGDFVECGVYQGVSTRIVASYLDFANVPKKWFLYDLFDNAGGDGQGIQMLKHGPGLYEKVLQSFATTPNVEVIKGRVPDVFSQVAPERIAFLHLDLNDASAEIGALNVLFPRMVAGSIIVFDDYGWAVYHAQQEAEDAFFAQHGHSILELPTGQGLLIKR
jgi:O-methyltransferase